MFLKENLTLAKLLMSILCDCELESILTVLVQSGAHHTLVYYTHMFEFTTVLQAKSALAVIVNKVEEHFQHFVKLTDAELSKVQIVLTTCVKTKNLWVRLIDRQGSSDFDVIGFLKLLRNLTANPENMLSLGSSIFIDLYHAILVEPDLSDAAKSVLQLLKVVCGNKQAENIQLLSTLETFSGNESLQAIAVEIIWSILNKDDSSSKYVCMWILFIIHTSHGFQLHIYVLG